MNRRITYATQSASSDFALKDQVEQMIDLSTLASTIAGHATIAGTPALFNGFFCTPTTSPSLTVNVSDGAIFTQQDVDETDFGTAPSIVPADNRQIMKFAYKLDPTPFTYVVPVTVGQSRNDLIQISFQEADGDSTALNFFGGVTNKTVLTPTGTTVIPVANNAISDTVNVERLDNVIINVKAGVAAPTGTQTTPTPDAGYIGAWVITTTHGVSIITEDNIVRYTDPSLTGDYETSAIIETLPEKISIITGDARYARKGLLQYNSGIINGGMTVAQRQPFSLTASTLGIGLVDTMMGKVVATTVTAGTLTQGTAQSYSYTGYTTRFSGVTTTGATTFTTAHRIESNDAVNYLNNTASFSVGVNHDFAINATFQIVIAKANAKNNFSATTTISTSSTVVVATATPTLLKFENVSMGDCTNGIQITITATLASGITTKNLHIYDMQLNTGEIADPFYPQDETTVRIRCMRRYEKSYDDTVVIGAITNAGATATVSTSGNQMGVPVYFKQTKVIAPAVTIYSPFTGDVGQMGSGGGDSSGTITNTGTKSFGVEANVADADTNYEFHWQAIADI